MKTGAILIILVVAVAVALAAMFWIVRELFVFLRHRHEVPSKYSIDALKDETLHSLTELRKKKDSDKGKGTLLAIFLTVGSMGSAAGQTADGTLIEQPGIIITIVLILIPLLLAVAFLVAKAWWLVRRLRLKRINDEAVALAGYISGLDQATLDEAIERRRDPVGFHTNGESGYPQAAQHRHGLIRPIRERSPIRFVAPKVKGEFKSKVDPALGQLVIWYLGCATFWLIFGTTVGEYLGIKFVAPDVDHVDWLSFGKLRPVHTNAVFWGWSSLAMLGLAYYVLPIVSNTKLASIRIGYISLWLINLAVVAGSVGLMAGLNNGGGEYREYPWPFMVLFGAALVLTLRNFFITIGRRKTREIYISNWYIVSAIIFTLVITFIAYWPSWQKGLGETIVQGYYMHQGVGMWFMLFTLGLVYYFLPQQLNKPIYSYSLGILAFWTQILFYTLIGTHHFVFSAIPWWLQTVAIVGSAGMLIPVTAGTANFLMTFRGSWSQLSNSYVLPFFLVGIVFYFTGSYQGTAEAFRYTNLVWHFTDFTVAHSHLTMYGIIAFLLWGSTYALLPRITGREPSHTAVGVHFWLALIGLLFYTIPLMIGGTLKGVTWMEGSPFIESVKLMAPYWLWRAIGGTLMWVAHLVFAFNFYRMVSRPAADVEALAITKLKELKEIA